MNRILSIFFLTIISSSLFGQDDSPKKKTYFITKAVDNEDNKIFIPFAHVFNESLRTSAISDTAGIIKIRANINDTLVITAVGYYSKVIMMNDKHISPGALSNTVLKRRSYNIQEVSIHALGTYQQFKKRVENLDLPYTKEEVLRAKLKKQSLSIAREAFTLAENKRMLADHPNDIRLFGASISSHEDLELKRYRDMLKKEARKEVIYSKFNKTIIKKITRLEEPELTDFFVFCNFNEKFLYDASEYEVGEAIKNKFVLYLAMKEENNETKDSIAN